MKLSKDLIGKTIQIGCGGMDVFEGRLKEVGEETITLHTKLDIIINPDRILYYYVLPEVVVPKVIVPQQGVIAN